MKNVTFLVTDNITDELLYKIIRWSRQNHDKVGSYIQVHLNIEDIRFIIRSEFVRTTYKRFPCHYENAYKVLESL